MDTKKKLIILCMALVLCVTIGGTLAFSTSSQDDTNIMTTGSVKIKQHEYEREQNTSGEYTSNLITFKQGKEIKPAYYVDRELKYEESYQSWNTVGVNTQNKLYDDSVRNVIDKFVFVENAGKSNLYFRTIIAIECPEGFDIDFIQTNINNDGSYTWENLGYATISGTRYYLKVATYKEALTPTQVSEPSLLQVLLKPNTKNEHMELLGKTFDILVKTQATQSETGVDPSRMLDDVFGNVIENLPWDEVVIPCIIKNQEELKLFFETGGSCVLGNDITFEGDLGTRWTPFSSIKQDTILNTNGYKLITNQKSNFAYNIFITIGENGKLTLDGKGLISQSSQATSGAYNGTIYSISNAEVTINDGKYHSAGSTYNRTIWAENKSIVTINGGEFTNEGDDSYLIQVANDAAVYINGGTFTTSSTKSNNLFRILQDSPNARIIISGGTFNVDPSIPHGKEEENKIIITEGYKVIDNNDGTWSVVPE